jgi:hypothetical protein
MRPHSLALALLALAAPALAAAQEARPYEVTIDSQMQVKSVGLSKPQPMAARTSLAYEVQARDGLTELVVRSMSVSIEGDGKTLMESRMSREAASFQKGEASPTRIPYDQATPSLKKTLDQFDAPLARFSAADPETREVLAPQDSPLVENGVIEQARFFLVPFPEDRDTWEVPTRFSLGNNQFAQGTLTYTKAGARADGKVDVDVAGTLRASGKLGLGEIKEATYKVAGRQVYDPGAKAWDSGTVNLDITLVMESGGHEAGSATGTMKVSLAPGKPADADVPTPPAPTEPDAPAGEEPAGADAK